MAETTPAFTSPTIGTPDTDESQFAFAKIKEQLFLVLSTHPVSRPREANLHFAVFSFSDHSYLIRAVVSARSQVLQA